MSKHCKCHKVSHCAPCKPCVPPRPRNPPIVEVIRRNITAQQGGNTTPNAGQVFASGILGNGLQTVASVTAGQLNFF